MPVIDPSPSRPSQTRRLDIRLLKISLLCLAAAVAALPDSARAAETCGARSGTSVPTVVELYTSEGCSSCPPADRWLSGLKQRDGVVTLAFHVDYWDSLGWKDRFAQPQFTQRQNASRRTSGARFAYTPQVIVNGRDTPDWSRLEASGLEGRNAGTVALQLRRDAAGRTLMLTIAPGIGAPARLAGYLAVVDDDLESRVGAGENRGATLHQDSVVRELLPWTADGSQTTSLHFPIDANTANGLHRRWIAVATDQDSLRPLQAVTLACQP